MLKKKSGEKGLTGTPAHRLSDGAVVRRRRTHLRANATSEHQKSALLSSSRRGSPHRGRNGTSGVAARTRAAGGLHAPPGLQGPRGWSRAAPVAATCAQPGRRGRRPRGGAQGRARVGGARRAPPSLRRLFRGEALLRPAGGMAAVETRVCETDGCTREAKLQCPTCIKLGIQGSYFCSQVAAHCLAARPGRGTPALRSCAFRTRLPRPAAPPRAPAGRRPLQLRGSRWAARGEVGAGARPPRPGAPGGSGPARLSPPPSGAAFRARLGPAASARARERAAAGLGPGAGLLGRAVARVPAASGGGSQPLAPGRVAPGGGVARGRASSCPASLCFTAAC